MTLEHTTIQTNGINLHVVQAGDPNGTPIILLHGFPEFWYSWRNQIEPLTQAGFRLYMPDQRGYNLSDKPKNVADYNLDTLADDIIGLIDHIGVEKVRIVAHDWGGAAAWWLANRNPDRVEKLAVLNIPHHAVFAKALKTNAKQRRKSLYMMFFQLKGLSELLLKFRGGSTFARWAFGKDNPAFTPEDIEKYKAAWAQPGAITAMLNWYRAIRKYRPQSIRNPKITVPLLLIWGKQDVAFEPNLAADSIRLCTNGELKMIEQASHWVQHEAAEEVNAALLEWL